jgi:hypothetical protein
MFLKSLALILCLLFLLYAKAFAGRSVFQKQFGNREVEVQVDAYNTNIDFYQPLTAKPILCLAEENEFQIYRHLLLSPLPRYLMFEVSASPLPWMGVLLRKNDQDLYSRANALNNLNLVQALCAGFEEPYAVSLFMGNVVSFRPKGADDCAGKGYSGVLLSGGNYHIQDSQLIDDNWLQGEVKFKGDKEAPDKKISWGFSAGAKVNRNPYIKDVYYFDVRRDRADFNDNAFSFLKNSGIEYAVDIDRISGKVIRHFFRIGKKLALKKRYKFTCSLDVGVIWEGADKYTGPLERTNGAGNLQFLLQPNIDFGPGK